MGKFTPKVMKRNISGFARECLGLPFGGYFGLPGDNSVSKESLLACICKFAYSS